MQTFPKPNHPALCADSRNVAGSRAKLQDWRRLKRWSPFSLMFLFYRFRPVLPEWLVFHFYDNLFAGERNVQIPAGDFFFLMKI